MRIVTSETMAEIDRLSQEEYRIPGILLMENAGAGAFHRLQSLWESSRDASVMSDLRWVCIAGGGNNGGDALVMARHALIAGINGIHVIMRNRKMNELASVHQKIVSSLGIPVSYWEEDREEARNLIRQADLVIDGIAGTGMKGSLRGSAAEIVECLNDECPAYIAAVDIPSGLSSSYRSGYPVVQSDLTLTMGLPKLSLYTPAGRSFCGEIEVIDPGFPPELLQHPKDAAVLIMKNAWNCLWQGLEVESVNQSVYKNTRGHLGVFAGNTGTTGAALLAAESAGRTGTGLVTLYTDPPLFQIAASQLLSVMVRPLDPEAGAEKDPAELFGRPSAFLAGPGWGIAGREGLLLRLLESGIPGVIDADGLSVLKNLLKGDKSEKIPDLLNENWILTPHPGEFMKLADGTAADCGKDDLLAHPLEAMKSLSRTLKCIICLKTQVVWIVHPNGRYVIIDGMNAAMGTGGSGDILAGITAGLLSRGISPFEAVIIAASVHQQAGAIAAGREGWFLSEDLLPYISVLLGGGDGQRPQ